MIGEFFYAVSRFPRCAGQNCIKIYQRTISLDHGPLAKLISRPVCRFHPTCSEFGYQAIGRFGLIKGSWYTLLRILRCHPWSSGGFDPVPPPPKSL